MKSELKYALIFSAMQVIWLFLEYTSGLQTIHKELHPLVSMLIVIPAAVIFSMGIRAKKKELEGVITFKQAAVAGILISFVAAMLSPVVMLIFSRSINPNFFTDFQNYAVEKGQMTLEQAMQYFNLSSYMLQSAMGTMLMGTVISTIVAFIIKNKR
jgi:hypothetical protein